MNNVITMKIRTELGWASVGSSQIGFVGSDRVKKKVGPCKPLLYV